MFEECPRNLNNSNIQKNRILSLIAINAAAPEGTPPRRINNQMSGSGNLRPRRACGEALRRGGSSKIFILANFHWDAPTAYVLAVFPIFLNSVFPNFIPVRYPDLMNRGRNYRPISTSSCFLHDGQSTFFFRSSSSSVSGRNITHSRSSQWRRPMRWPISWAPSFAIRSM